MQIICNISVSRKKNNIDSNVVEIKFTYLQSNVKIKIFAGMTNN
jgi:hypothetical protein